jgi:hypothetical protein
MEPDRTIAGQIVHGVVADWRPLDKCMRDELVPWFVWIGEIELEDGTRVQSYRFVPTDRDVHLAKDGRAFECVADGRYRYVDPLEALMASIEKPDGFSCVSRSRPAVGVGDDEIEPF